MCTETGLHPNTVRGHLEVLVAAQSVTRERGPAKGRGRPPWLYDAAEVETPESYEELKAALSQQLAEADESTLAREAAVRWADLEAESNEAPISDNDDAVTLATESLNQAGFLATQSFAGDRIEVTSCPYSELVTEHPVICNIHTALLSEVLDRADQEVAVDRMDVWVRPGMCVAHLNRTDVTPARIITADELSGKNPKRSGKKSKKD
jgi:predicted ArsR family transcriptional regulator